MLGRPSISDTEFDGMLERLRQLEREHPELRSDDSPTQRVGSDLSHDFPEVEHRVPVLSLDKAYSYEELIGWVNRTAGGSRAGAGTGPDAAGRDHGAAGRDHDAAGRDHGAAGASSEPDAGAPVRSADAGQADADGATEAAAGATAGPAAPDSAGERDSSAGATAPVLVAEEKIDGVSIVLYYRDGALERAVTRGNGRVGNDVTANVRTIASVPLRLREPATVAVRGEIYLPISEFRALNERGETAYANPRNLAAGSLRRAKSAETAAVPLTMFAYEAYFDGERHASHRDILHRMTQLGFRLNPTVGFFSAAPAQLDGERERFPGAAIGDLAELREFITRETEERTARDYEIDGLVLKLDSLERRELLGYTGHHPRWAIAYKFESPEGVTTVRAIDVQVGRTGRVTPVARVEPVFIGGTTVSNVTLHNQAYVDALELGLGDIVAVSRRGDVIPAVERVVEKNPESGGPYRMPERCPSCDSVLEQHGAHHFCVNYECPARMRGQLYFFVGRSQMDIDSLGTETLSLLIDEGMVRDVADIYDIDFDRLREYEGFGDRKIAALRQSIEESRTRPYRTVLASLGIPEIGPKVVELLADAGYHSIDDLFAAADAGDPEPLLAIDGIGERTAGVIITELSRPSLRDLVARLRAHGLNFSEDGDASRGDDGVPRQFAGQVWCVTGSFEHFKPRSRAAEQIKRRGGRVAGDVSGRTTHLLAGENAGSKLTRAGELGVEIVDEERFLRMLGGGQAE